ncbi:MAG: radical SAM protein [bacterium]|nr:radical SAM protein [bacterium]
MDIRRVISHCSMAYGMAYSIAANQLGVVPRPRMGYLMMTWKCNLRCVMCGVWKEERYKQLDTQDYKKLIRKLPFLDIVKVGGGEPFMRDDMPELITELQNVANPYYIMLITNGTMKDRIVEFAKQCGKPGLHLRLSIEGRGEVHDKLRGRKGCFDKTMATLEALLPIMREKKFVIGINYNITPETIEHLPWIRGICRKEGLNFIPGYWVTPFLEPGDPKDSKPMVGDFADYRRRLEELYEQTKGVNALEAYFLKKTVFRMYDDAMKSGIKKFACRCNRSILYVMPDGEAVTCGIKHGSIGNLVNEDFDDVWFGQKARLARKDVDACPGCHQYAIKIMSRAYTGESFGLPAPGRFKCPFCQDK